jgi:peroxiredoxin
MKTFSILALLLLVANTLHADETPTLAQQLEAKAAASANNAPPAMKQAFAQGIAEVESLGLAKSAKQIGDLAIDGELTAWDGTKVKLSDEWEKQPVVLTWYRGGWCPYCNLQLQAMQKSLAELRGAGAKLIAISPELPENVKATAQTNRLTFLMLHDANNTLAKQYGIVFELPEVIKPMYRDRLQLGKVNGSNELALPLAATYVIDTKGRIRWAFLDSDYKKRAEPAEVVAAIKSLQE